MFKPWLKGGRLIGYTFESSGRFYFFGSRHVSREDLSTLFPKYEFCFLKQVHGRAVVAADPLRSLEADGHVTSVPGRALVAQSADCIPLLLSSAEEVCAIHAGWRGVAGKIVAALSEKMPQPNFAAIGPHICKASFEVGLDVAELLLNAAPPGFAAPALNTAKVQFDLKSLVMAQLSACFGPALPVAECCEDTKTNNEFCSYRRDGKQAGRQYSFVVIT